MRVAVLIPVGPGHEGHVKDALLSVREASVPNGWVIKAAALDDTQGKLGRSKARNLLSQAAILRFKADWLFYLDADDLCDPDCFRHAAATLYDYPDLEAIWGQIVRQRAWRGSDGRVQKLEVLRSDDCRAPLMTREALLELPGFSTLRVGHFIRPSLFQRVGGWLETEDVGEDHEFHYACAMHATKFAKIDACLVWIRVWLESAYGPRGYLKGDVRLTQHMATGEGYAQYWRDRGPVHWTDEEKEIREEGRLYD